MSGGAAAPRRGPRARAGRYWGILVGGVLLGAPVATTGSPQSDSSITPPRVFTEAQARRGQGAYSRTCEFCHGADLRGDSAEEIPDLASRAFAERWEDRTLDDLFGKIQRTMPANAPGTLSPSGAIDLVAYLLQTNGAVAGTEELTPETEGLNRLSVGVVLGATR